MVARLVALATYDGGSEWYQIAFHCVAMAPVEDTTRLEENPPCPPFSEGGTQNLCLFSQSGEAEFPPPLFFKGGIAGFPEGNAGLPRSMLVVRLCICLKLTKMEDLPRGFTYGKVRRGR